MRIPRIFLINLFMLLAALQFAACSGGDGSDPIPGESSEENFVATHDGTDPDPDPVGVQISLQGCRSTLIPTGYDLEANNFVCPDPAPLGGNDSAYTGGNLFQWNELDLVPHRVIFSAGNSAPDSQDYTVAITADTLESGIPGYDVITVPVLDANFSDASCSIDAVSAEMSLTPGAGGADHSLYRFVSLTQLKNTTCVINYALRLAVGSHLFPGSSLHANMLNHELSTGGIGAQDVSIPVNQIEAQDLEKAMTATQDSDHIWNVTKGPNPTNLNFGDTCSPDAVLAKSVSFRVDWTILPATPGMITIVTNIYATNPASRTITIQVSDDIRTGTTVLDTLSSSPVNIPAQTADFLVLTHSVDVAAGTTDLNDVATASYTDLVTGVPVPGMTTATASADVQPGTITNTTATITDVENISGNGLQYSADSTSGASGAFQNGYILGTPIAGPVTWISAAQSGNGFSIFNKTVYLDQPRVTTGTLSDTANLLGSDGFTTSASASIGIMSNASVSLSIRKTIPDILQGDDTLSVEFTVSGPDAYEENVSIDFSAGETDKSTSLSGLVPGNYVVTEQPVPGLSPVGGNQKNVDINLPNCSGEVVFNNEFSLSGLALAEVRKVTFPAGHESGWLMTLSGPDDPQTLTTSGVGFHPFPLSLLEGTYTITETAQPGWDQTMAAGCTFTVDYPDDFGQVFQCTLQNTQRGTIVINKTTDPAGGTGFSFTDDIENPNAFNLDDGQSKTFLNVLPGTYMVVETDPTPAFDLTALTCNDSQAAGTASVGDVPNRKATVHLDPGETVECTFSNRQRGMVTVNKLKSGQPDTVTPWNFTLQGPQVNTADSTAGDGVADFGMAKLIPGEDYTLCETGVPAGWDTTWLLDGQSLIPFNPDSPENLGTLCVVFQVAAGLTVQVVVDNLPPPGGEPRTIGYWKNWSTCTPGNQAQTAANNGGAEEGFDLLDDHLPMSLGDPNSFELAINTCEEGVWTLDKRDWQSQQKKASDAAFSLAAQLLASKLNFAADAEACAAAQTGVSDGDTLLGSIGFDGSGDYLPPKSRDSDLNLSKPQYNALRAEAIELAGTLASYNEGILCP